MTWPEPPRVRTAGAPSRVTRVSCTRAPFTLNGTEPPIAKLKSPSVAPPRIPGMQCSNVQRITPIPGC